MRLLVAMGLILLILQHSFMPLYVFTRFKANQAWIEKNLCVQKDEEVNSCHGNCQLKAEMQSVIDEANDEPNKALPRTKSLKIKLKTEDFLTPEISVLPAQAFFGTLFVEAELSSYLFNCFENIGSEVPSPPPRLG